MIKQILAFSLTINLCAQANNFNKPEESVSLKRGETVTVSLPSNPTTGYSWGLCSKNTRNTIVGITELEYKANQPQLVGSGGTQTWQVTGKKRGSAHIKFEYRRPWEKGVVPAQIKRYLFTVN